MSRRSMRAVAAVPSRSFQVNSSGTFPYTLTSLRVRQPLMDHIEIRHCATLLEYEECVRLEHATWGEEHRRAVGNLCGRAPHGRASDRGVLRSRQNGRFHARRSPDSDGKPFLHSHMTAVLPEFRDRGVGRRLKLFQRQDALKRGIALDRMDIRSAGIQERAF